MPRLASLIPLDIASGTAATVYTNGNLSTTPVQYPDAASSAFSQIRHVIVTNKHATNHVGIGLSLTTGSPTFGVGAAGAVNANEGITVFPQTSYELVIPAKLSLWLVASAGSTPVAVRAFDSRA
jgi:hypothetical protein